MRVQRQGLKLAFSSRASSVALALLFTSAAALVFIKTAVAGSRGVPASDGK